MANFPTGSLPLLEVAKHTGDPLTVAYTEVIISETNILGKMPWQAVMGEAVRHEEEVSLPDPQFRDLNETYTPSFGTDREWYWGTATLGSEVIIDTKMVRQYGEAGAKRRQYRKHAKATGLFLQKNVFDGTGSASNKDFRGVNLLIEDGFGKQVFADGAGSAEAELTLDMLDSTADELRTGEPDDIWLNRQTRTNITQLTRELGGGFSWINISRNMFGEKVVEWMDTPLSIIGQDHLGNFILDFDEDPGDGGNDTASLYMVRYGEEHFSGLMGFGGALSVRDFGEVTERPGHLGRTELYPGIMIADQYSIARLRGFILNDFTA